MVKLGKFSVIIIVLSVLFLCACPSTIAESECVVYLFHKGTGQILTAEGADEMRDCAGLARLAPLVVISESIEDGSFKLSTDITVSKSASKVKGPTAFVEANERISAEALYKSAAMICAGDAVYALAEAISGSEEGFVAVMNERLCELGVDCKYEDIIGQEVRLSARDIGKLAVALSECECYLKYSGIYMDSIEHAGGNVTELVNPNRLARNLMGCKGLATGSSAEAGYCGAFYAERNGCEYICIVLGAEDSTDRFDRARAQIEAAFNSYTEYKIASAGEVLMTDFPIKGTVTRGCDIIAASDLYVLTENTSEKPKCEYDIPNSLNAPIQSGTCIGNVRCMDASGNVLAVAELTVGTDIKKAGFWDFFVIYAEEFMRR